MTDLNAIIDGMSEMQRVQIVQLDETYQSALPTGALYRNGLLDYRPKYWIFGEKRLSLTRLGQAVRARIIERKDHEA